MSALNVLLVTYSFPPAGGVGVLRAASLARYLPGQGIRLHVLTARNASAVGADASLLNEIPAEVEVHRTVTLDIPFGIKKLIKRVIMRGGAPAAKAAAASAGGRPGFLKRIVQDILLPDPQVTWLPALTRAARHIVKAKQIDVVVITVPPFSSVLLVERLRRQFPHLAIVVDFRDEWLSTTIDLVSFSHSERARRLAIAAEASAVKNATAVVAVTEVARREIQGRYPEEPAGKFHHVPNGFDASRLRPLLASSVSRLEGKIIVAYVGTIYPSTDPTALVEALLSLPAEVRSRFTLRFIGHIEEPRYREALLQLGDTVELKGYMPQHEALRAMSEADYALLITHDRLNVSAKFYDYIGARKPILACIHPDGDVRRLLEGLRAGWWAGSDDVEGMRSLFIDAAARGDALQAAFQPDAAKVAQFERKVLAERYAQLLYDLAGKGCEADSPARAAGAEA
jgi:glycosyltransferase involved in cell wall biosynthesis